MRWLNRTQEEVAKLCDFSLRALLYWTSGTTRSPRPSTVRRLHEIHAFVRSLVAKIGVSETQAWLSQPLQDGMSRLELLQQEDGVRRLIRQASSILFAEVPRPERPRAERDDDGDDTETTQAFEARPTGRVVRRPRRAPRPEE